jgi:hypothetical protein
MDSIKFADGRITGSFGTTRVEIREIAARECVVTHSAQIRVGTTGSLVLRLDDETLAMRASVVRSSLLAPSLEGMIYRSTLRIDAADDIRIRQLFPQTATGEQVVA